VVALTRIFCRRDGKYAWIQDNFACRVLELEIEDEGVRCQKRLLGFCLKQFWWLKVLFSVIGEAGGLSIHENEKFVRTIGYKSAV